MKEQKKALRRQIAQAIAALTPDYCAAADREIVSHLLSLPAYAAAGTVFCFVGSETEIDTTPFLERVLSDGKRLSVPLCMKKGIMQARQIRSLSELSAGYYGLLEPGPDTPLVLPEEIDLAIIPCVSCSHDGKRLGHGGGFYDIYFSANRQIPCVMICREKVMCEAIPAEAHDLIFDTVVSEKGIFQSGQLLHCSYSQI